MSTLRRKFQSNQLAANVKIKKKVPIKPEFLKFIVPHFDSEDIGRFEVTVEDVLRLEHGQGENIVLIHFRVSPKIEIYLTDI